MDTCIELEPDQIQLLDEAMRIAYTRLIDTGVARGHQFQTLRDPLVIPMVHAIRKGETNVWRIARRGLFAACAILASESLNTPVPRSAAA